MISPHIRRLSLPAVLVLVAAAGLGATPVHAANPGVSIQQYMFQPGTIQVPVGATVTWMNRDPFAHTVTSTSGAWDSGPLASNATFIHTFTTPGTFTYYCRIHPFMHGTVIVGTSSGMPAPVLGATRNPVRDGGFDLVVGRGFTPLGRVVVQWQRPDRTMAALTIRPNRRGAFAFVLFADPRHGCGPRVFTAVDTPTGRMAPQYVLQEIC